MNRQTNRHTQRQTDRHTDRQTDRHTDRQTDRQTPLVAERIAVDVSLSPPVCLPETDFHQLLLLLLLLVGPLMHL